ncbi:glycosyltransferase [Thermococcus paralvinellae]|uniref:Glycosyl transferase family protein 14 n=1 Tax=Thermococcus paralvinellae TaxID=582419 RepID=W0I5Q9_9EURY|nr:glycosyltransferase [Thermococcus paralvinellae]AHF81409.1 glycosyl transferase family protein 14 [Thermococcus paralvinellae]
MIYPRESEINIGDLNLLVITPFYRWFIKELIEAQSRYVGEIHILVHHNPLAEISNYVPFGGYFDHLRLYTKQRIVELENVPPNVHIHLISTVYFIPDGRNSQLGEKLAKKFEEHIKENNINFDIIHAHFTYPQGYAAVKLGQKFNAPVIITLHENRPHLYSILKNMKDKAVYTWKNADALIRVNKRDIPIFIQHGANPGRIVHIPNGYNPRKFSYIPREVAREKLQIEKNAKIIFNLARLYPEKGHKYLINAMSLVLKERQDVYCYIGGTGPLKKQLEKQISKLNLRHHIRLLGYLPDNQLNYWMNAADIFVLPSLSEGNPTVMFEALGVGLPFVGTAVGGVPEIIVSEDYGLLCPPADCECLAEKILIALDKKWNREKIRKYAQQFTWKEITKKLSKIYKEVLHQST